MTRRDWLWVFLKAFALYLLLQAVLAIPEVVQSTMIAFRDVAPSSPTLDRLDSFDHSLTSAARATLAGAIARLLLYSLIGLYLLCGGTRLLDFMCRGQESR